MYGRDYEGQTVNFEASGGLVHSSLVMQDKETDTYWSIMKGVALAGELEGTELVELPFGEKIQWRHWKARHPDTLVLSVEGREDGVDAYADYFRDSRGFRGEQASDDRLETKEPIFAFHYDGAPYAARQKHIENGAVFELEDGSFVFLYRRKGSSMFQSTRAFHSRAGFTAEGNDDWVETGTGARFEASSRLLFRRQRRASRGVRHVLVQLQPQQRGHQASRAIHGGLLKSSDLY